MRHASRTILALLSVGALLLGGCSDDGRDVTDRSKGGGKSDEPVLSPPDEPPTIEGPLLDYSPYKIGNPPADDENVAQIILSDPQDDPPFSAVYIELRPTTQILVADDSGSWRAARFDELSEGGETQAWDRQDEPLDEGSGDGFVAKAITFRPPAVAPGRPTSPPPWNEQVAGSVASVAPCLSVDSSANCADGVVATVLAEDSNRPESDLLVGVTADTTILVHDGTAWAPGSLDHVTPGAPIRVWTSEYQLKRTDPDHGLAEAIAIGPVDLW